MGLLTSVNGLKYEMEAEKQIKLEERKRKRKEQTQKENLKRLFLDLEEYTKSEFDKYFIIGGTPYLYEFYDRNRKQEILLNFLETLNDNDKTAFGQDLRRYFAKNYDSWLKKEYTEQKNQEAYDTIMEAEKLLEQENQKTKWQKIKESGQLSKIIITILLLPLLPLLLIIFILAGCLKNTK